MPDDEITPANQDGANGGGASRDPGDAVPPGVAPAEPVPLTEQDKKVLEKLEKIGDPEAGHPRSHI